MKDIKTNNPFVPADWEGAKCTNCPGIGMIGGIQCTDCKGTGRVPYWGRWTPDLDDMSDAAMLEICIDKAGNIGDGHSDVLNCNGVLPLLPSIELINAQPNPREAAIQALERAGFALSKKTAILRFSKFDYITVKVSRALYEGEPRTCLTAITGDENFAQYAVDCFKVLKAWCDKVAWGGGVE